jgi:hypothetical protein
VEFRLALTLLLDLLEPCPGEEPQLGFLFSQLDDGAKLEARGLEAAKCLGVAGVRLNNDPVLAGQGNMYRMRDVTSRGVKFGIGRVAGASSKCIPMSSSRAG